MLVPLKGLLWNIAWGPPARTALCSWAGVAMLERTALPCQECAEWLAHLAFGFHSPRRKGTGRLPVGNNGRALPADSADDMKADQQQDDRAPRVPHRPHAGRVQP